MRQKLYQLLRGINAKKCPYAEIVPKALMYKCEEVSLLGSSCTNGANMEQTNGV